jgi:serine protease
MVRWGLIGLLVLAACGNGVHLYGEEDRVCPGVRAGPFAPPAQAPRLEADPDDGREAFLLRYRHGARLGATSVERTGGQVTRVFRTLPLVAARLTPEERARLMVEPDLETLEPDGKVRALGWPGPSARTSPPPRSGSPSEYTPGIRLVQAPQVWDANGDGLLDEGAPIGDGIRVCVIDSGIDPRHPELQLPYVEGYDFVEEDEDPSDRTGLVWGSGHGTHVAGTIAAQPGMGARPLPGMPAGGTVGVAPGVQLLIARVLDLDGTAPVSSMLAALEWCMLKEANIVNLSLGGPMLGSASEEAFQRAADAGLLIFAAAGNDRTAAHEAPVNYPAAFPSVVAVGAVDDQAHLASFSNVGPPLELVAPGVDIVSTVILGDYSLSALEAGGRSLPSHPVARAPQGDYTGELVDCGSGERLSSCRRGSCEGFVAWLRPHPLVTPGDAVQNVMLQGARAVVFGAHPSKPPSRLSLGRPGHWVPTVAVDTRGDAFLREQLGRPVRVGLEQVDYAPMSGTSMATPHAAGVAALIWSTRPSLPAAQVRALLQDTARDLGEPGRDPGHGFGLVQARKALDRLNSQP